MAHYRIKSWPRFFQPIVEGRKKHDLRDKRDRPYAVGDTLTLQEYDPFDGVYTGREQDVEVTFITSNDTPCAFSNAYLARDAAILSIDLIGPLRSVDPGSAQQ